MTTEAMVEVPAADLDELRRRLRRLEDIEEIRRLKAAYCAAADGGWPEKGPSHMGPFADLFVEDGVWEAQPAGLVAEGREAIHEKVVLGHRPIPFIMHYTMNPSIEVDGDRATGEWHVIATAEDPDGSSAWILGVYHEEYVRTPEGWRYELCRFTHTRGAVQERGWKALAR